MDTITQQQYDNLDGMALSELAGILSTSQARLMTEFGSPDSAIAGAANLIRQYVAGGTMQIAVVA